MGPGFFIFIFTSTTTTIIDELNTVYVLLKSGIKETMKISEQVECS